MGLKQKLMSISLAGMTAGSALLGAEPPAEKTAGSAQTEQTARTLSYEEMLETMRLERAAREQGKQTFLNKDGEECTVNYGYEASFLFNYTSAILEKNPSFTFDGVTYKTETAFHENELLKAARLAGRPTYTFNDQEKNACSTFPAKEQMRVFGNLYEELIAPQDQVSENYLKEYALTYTPRKGDSSETLNRLYQVWRASGYPEIRNQTEENMTLMGRVIEKGRRGKTAHFEPSMFGRDTIYLSPIGRIDQAPAEVGDLLPEMAHAFRHNNHVFGEGVQFVRDGLKDLLSFNSAGFGTRAQSKNYDNPDRMEYDTHQIVEPALEAFVKGEINTLEEMYFKIDTARKRNGNEYTWTGSAEKQIASGAQKSFDALQKEQGGLKLADLAQRKTGRSG